jgi:hypothetical protein
MYLAFSRGLLAQVVMNFCFSMFPLLMIYRFLPKVRVLNPIGIAGTARNRLLAATRKQ